MKPYSLIACAALSLTATFSDAEQAGVQERGYSGNPVINGWYADPQMRIYNGKYWIFPTYSAKYGQQTFLDVFSSDDLETWTRHKRILDTLPSNGCAVPCGHPTQSKKTANTTFSSPATTHTPSTKRTAI